METLKNSTLYSFRRHFFFFFTRIAYTALNDHESAMECYRKALDLDPTNQSYQNNLEIAEQKLKEEAARVSYYYCYCIFGYDPVQFVYGLCCVEQKAISKSF